MPYGVYLSVVLKRWWVIALATVVAVATAYGVTRFQRPVYRSSVKLLVTPGKADLGQQLTVEKQLRQIAQRVKVTEIAREVDQRRRLDLGADRLLGMIKAEGIIDQGYVQIDAEDTDPARAEQIAAGFGEVFVEQHSARNLGLPQAERLNVELLDRPSSAVQVYPQPRVAVLAATILGLCAGLVLAFGLEYLDDTVKTARQIDEELGLTTLGWIPFVAVPRSAGDRRG
ncbi:MAG: hypothetical protein IT307_19545 [Chloroflexi bacterium]|nr:hypothetical protein [Chloroflexota bacterium]